MRKTSFKSLPAAAAMAAALLFGAQAMAQTEMSTPPGSTKSKDAVRPAPGNTVTPARVDPGTVGAYGTTDLSTSSLPMTADERSAAIYNSRMQSNGANNASVGNLGFPASKGDGNGKS